MQRNTAQNLFWELMATYRCKDEVATRLGAWFVGVLGT